MKTRIHYAGCPQEYLTAFGLNPSKVIYFDIETTGFRASTSRLYMIGWAVQNDFSRNYQSDSNKEQKLVSDGKSSDGYLSDAHAPCQDLSDDDWIVTQIMAESSAEEVILLEQFKDVLGRYDTIIEFNGDRFDLPYMQEKYASYNMEDPFANCTTIDLFREIRPYKNMLGLSRLNQKSVEQFLHITRNDPYTGGELIDVYRSVRDHTCANEETAVNALFLHNYEDVLGMLAMTPLLSYHLAMESTAAVSIRRSDDPSSPDCELLEVSFALEVPVPVPLSLCAGGGYKDDQVTQDQPGLPKAACCITISGKQAIIRLYPLPLCLYHFFSDYRNYYYLPEEDTAIHKSVASFVDKSHREKAKAQNCYIKKQGYFLPQASQDYQPAFQRRYKDTTSWFEYQPGMEEDIESFSAYIHALIRIADIPGS